MKMIQPNLDQPPREQKEDDLMVDDLKQYDADIEAMNLILISIPNDIYNSVDACENAKDIWDRVKRLMQGIVVEVKEGHTILKRSLLGVVMFRKRLGMYKELYELLRQEMLQMFGVTIVVLKVTMHGIVQSQEFRILTVSFETEEIFSLEEDAKGGASLSSKMIDDDVGVSSLLRVANPNEHHVSAVKRIFHYLKGTTNLGLWYSEDSGFDLTAYLDADHAGCHLDQKSTSGSVQFLGDKLVCWSSKKQNCVSISTSESKYVAVSGCCAQVLWMHADHAGCHDDCKSTSGGLQFLGKKLVIWSYKKQDCTTMSTMEVEGTVELYFIWTEYQLADLFTKALPKERFEYLVHQIGMRRKTPMKLDRLAKIST
nr:hypothetical protein [Tanacetum cinerariifolium]